MRPGAEMSALSIPRGNLPKPPPRSPRACRTVGEGVLHLVVLLFFTRDERLQYVRESDNLLSQKLVRSEEHGESDPLQVVEQELAPLICVRPVIQDRLFAIEFLSPIVRAGTAGAGLRVQGLRTISSRLSPYWTLRDLPFLTEFGHCVAFGLKPGELVSFGRVRPAGSALLSRAPTA